jgi:signal transduction histidine kinase
MESAQLIDFFDGVVTAADIGDFSILDVAVQALVADRLGQGYSLTDFLDTVNKLKVAIWDAARTSLAPDQALQTIVALEAVFAHSTARFANQANRAAEAQIEGELELARRTLAKLDRSKSDFINIAAHELKTPLTLIQGYTAILASELSERQGLQGILRGLTNGIKRLQTLIQDMIDVSLIDSDVLTLSFQPVSLYDVVKLTIEDRKQEAVTRQLKLKVESFPPELNGIYLDARRMYQVFSNLIGNAIKFTPDHGEVSVTAQVLSDPKMQLKFAEVAVADTGIGIAPDELAVIFDKFYRVGESALHSTSKTQFKGGGPGLGLPIVKGVVEAHGGRVWAESPGYDEQRCPGSTFHVMLPLNTERPTRASERLLGLESE